MDKQQVTGDSSTPVQYPLSRTIAATFLAGLVAVGVSILGRIAAWPHPLSIAFGTFLFLIPIVQPLRQGQQPRSWTSRFIFGVITGVIGGLIHAFFLDG